MERVYKTHFEHLGYFREYLQGLTCLGFVLCEKDRDTEGYNGRRKETTTAEVILTNGKKIKPGTEVTTILYPLCGKKLNK